MRLEDTLPLMRDLSPDGLREMVETIRRNRLEQPKTERKAKKQGARDTSQKSTKITNILSSMSEEDRQQLIAQLEEIDGD